MIIDPATLLVFVPAALALNFTPGADMMFCLGQGLKGGPRSALAADAGIAAGVMVHTIVAGLGLGAIVATSPWLFDAIRWIGIAYLLWLAWRTLKQDLTVAGLSGGHPSRVLHEAFLVNLTNPKVILFVLAFVPQFVNPDGPVFLQFLLLGGIISVGGLLVNGAVGIFAGGLGRRLAQSRRLSTGLKFASAGIFVGLAAKLLFTQKA